MPYSFMRKLGLSRDVARRLVDETTAGIKIAHLEKLCIALNCTPNDLMAYEDTNSLAADHPLQQLKRNKDDLANMQKLRKLSPEKIAMLGKLLDEMEGA